MQTCTLPTYAILQKIRYAAMRMPRIQKKKGLRKRKLTQTRNQKSNAGSLNHLTLTPHHHNHHHNHHHHHRNPDKDPDVFYRTIHVQSIRNRMPANPA